MQAGRLGQLLAFAGDEWDVVADDLLIAGESSTDGPYRTLCGGTRELPRVLSLESFSSTRLRRFGKWVAFLVVG